MDSVLWIGGAADAAKTTQARRLAEAHGLALLQCDADRAVGNAFGRDLLLGDAIQRRAAAHAFETFTIDGALDAAAVSQILERRFGPYLGSASDTTPAPSAFRE